MQNYRFRKLIVSIATCFLLAVALLFLFTEQAYAVGIENGFGASSDKEQIESFAAVYGWDPSLFLKKEWSSNGVKYERQSEYQMQALSDSYAAVCNQLMSGDELKKDDGSTTTFKEKTEAFLEKHHIEKGIDSTNTIVSGGKGGAAVAAVAASQIGVVENPPMSNQVEYNAFFGANGQEWCAYFLSWCAAKCGYDSKVFPPTGSTGEMYSQLTGSKGYKSFLITETSIYGGSYTPYPGDVVIYTTTGDRAGTQHCGIVQFASPGGITVIEGNTTGDGKIRGNEGVTTRTLTADYCNRNPNGAFGRYIVIIHVQWTDADYQEYYDYIHRRMGLNSAAACAIYSCIENVSEFNSTKKDQNTGRFGIAQWNPGTVEKLKEWCSKNKRQYTDEKAQIDFLLYDLRTNNRGLWTTLSSTSESELGAYNAVKLLANYFGLSSDAQTEVGNMSRQYWQIFNSSGRG